MNRMSERPTAHALAGIVPNPVMALVAAGIHTEQGRMICADLILTSPHSCAVAFFLGVEALPTACVPGKMPCSSVPAPTHLASPLPSASAIHPLVHEF